ncbi:efflux RND transporter periplasmic adaptor subunit [Actinomycetospora sp. CA-084318]|uniref:efflux RND transporter periplasmic adaptor subunit n=1 Tax=Actinomycetospora sp. CA-084318 TaxID=3239892 RepID=UPI003D95330F
MTTTAIRTPPAGPARRRRGRRGRTAIAVLLLLAIVIVIGGLTLTADAPSRPETAPVVRGSVVVQAHAEGSVVSRVATAAAFPVDGVIAGVDVTVGAAVRTGDVLATLDDTAVRPRVAAAEAALTADQRARDAAARAPVPDPVTLARLDAAISADRATLAEAQRVLDGGVLRAAQDGTVTVVRAQVGDRVTSASPPAVEIADLTGLVVRVGVEPAQVADVVVGRTAFVTTGGPRLRGQVVDVAPVPGPDGRYAVAISAPLPDTARIGVPAEASIVLARREGVLVVPPRALRPAPTPGTATVQVVRGQGTAGSVVRTVEVGLVGDDAVEVLDGLDVGEEVVVDGAGVPATEE